MPSYQSPTPPGDPTGRWLSFTAAVAVSAATRDWLAGKITTRRHAIRSRWRLLDPTTQATLVLAFLRTNLTHAELAAANHISASTCRRIINEGIDLLAQRAIRLSEVLRLAKKAGWEYLLIDGVNVPTVAFARKLNRRQQHYSGKHRRHGVNVQTICAPDGRLLWASAALPGKVNDITAARRHGLSPTPRRAVDRRATRSQPATRQPALPRRTRQRPAEMVPGAGHRTALPSGPLHPHDQGRADRLLPRTHSVCRIDRRLSRHPTNMIKTLACRKAESTVLSNHAVNCHNTTMNEVQYADPRSVGMLT